MIILNGDKKTIKISFSSKFYADPDEKDGYYKLEMPTVYCSDKNDAEYMQQKINTFVNDISQKLLK